MKGRYSHTVLDNFHNSEHIQMGPSTLYICQRTRRHNDLETKPAFRHVSNALPGGQTMEHAVQRLLD